ncbi:hypothetical protein PSTT_09053, partial [Puccinia striiformis]
FIFTALRSVDILPSLYSKPMAGPTATDQPVPTSTTNTTRLSRQALPQKKTGSKIEDTTTAATAKAVPTVPAAVDEPSEVIEPAPVPVVASVPEPLNLGLTSAVPSVPASASISPVQQQRIGGYESSTVPLNEDQKRAIASKPALEATVKELQDLLKILEDDEKLDELRIQAKKAESNLTFLLQFLHLYSLVNSATQPTESFAPPTLSPLIQSATAQELAAVNVLFHRLADGPIAGGDGDAFDSIDRFTQGSAVDVIEVAKVKEMVIQLTASPVELAPAPQMLPSTDQDEPTAEEETVPVNPAGPLGNMMFLQQSEVMPPVTVTVTDTENTAPGPVPDLIPPTSSPVPNGEKEPVIDHVARNKQLLEQATILTPDPLPSSMQEWTAGEQSQPSQLQAATPASQEWNTPPEHLSATQAEDDRLGGGRARTRRGSNNHMAPNFTPTPPPISHLPPGDLAAGQMPLGLPHHHMNHARGQYRGRGGGGGGGYRGGPGMPRGGGGNHDGYRGGGRGWYRGNPGGYRGGREGAPPMDMNGPAGWRPGPGEQIIPGGRYGGHRGGPRGGGNTFHRHPPPPSQQVYHPEVATGPGGHMY